MERVPPYSLTFQPLIGETILKPSEYDSHNMMRMVSKKRNRFLDQITRPEPITRLFVMSPQWCQRMRQKSINKGAFYGGDGSEFDRKRLILLYVNPQFNLTSR